MTFIVSFLSGLVLLLMRQFDDELAPEARALLEHASTAHSSDAYQYLLGIDTPAGQAPMEVGKRLLAHALQDERKLGAGTTPDCPLAAARG